MASVVNFRQKLEELEAAMAVRQRRIVGAILKIPLGKPWHAYAWTLPELDFAFFDLKSKLELPIEQIITAPVAFRIAVTHFKGLTNGRWPRVGKIKLPPALEAPDPQIHPGSDQ
jgi:hypothetical protein